MAKRRAEKNKKNPQKTDYEKIVLICMSILTVFALGAVIFSLTKKDTQKQNVTPTPTITANPPTPEVVIRPEEQDGHKLLEILESSPDKYITSQSSNRSTFSNENITFDYDPSLFDIEYSRAARLLGRLYDFQSIDVVSKDKTYMLELRLNMEGIGGGCPDFPEGYVLTPITLSEKPAEKAKFIDSQRAHESWPLGDIHIVTTGDYGYRCPNVAGIYSDKNGGSKITYKLNTLYQSPEKYNDAEKKIDSIVNSIKGFW